MLRTTINRGASEKSRWAVVMEQVMDQEKTMTEKPAAPTEDPMAKKTNTDTATGTTMDTTTATQTWQVLTLARCSSL